MTTRPMIRPVAPPTTPDDGGAARRWLARSLFALATALAVNSVLGPLVAEVIALPPPATSRRRHGWTAAALFGVAVYRPLLRGDPFTASRTGPHGPGPAETFVPESPRPRSLTGVIAPS